MSQTLYSIGAGNYTGTIDIPAATIPEGISSIGISADCSNWTDTTSSMTVTYQMSVDGGSTWPYGATAYFAGGANNMHGQPLSNLAFDIGIPSGGGVKIKGTVTIVGTFVTSGIQATGS
jgi:hypothetical protein